MFISRASTLPRSVHMFVEFTFLDIEININFNVANVSTGYRVYIKSQVPVFVVLIQIVDILGWSIIEGGW